MHFQLVLVLGRCIVAIHRVPAGSAAGEEHGRAELEHAAFSFRLLNPNRVHADLAVPRELCEYNAGRRRRRRREEEGGGGEDVYS